MALSTVDNLQINRLELSEVYCPDDPQVDIVLVHGLNGHPKNTWTAKNGVFWPAQLLPRSLGNVKARILVYGYNADVYAFGGKSATSDYVHQHAQTLVTTLDAERFNEDATQRPIIFVAHSLGGILVKRALEYSAGITSDNTQDLRSIFVSTYGIIFLGTPHNGADPAKWGKVLESMCGALLPRKLLDTEPQLVRTLQTQSETLQNINLGFVNIMDRFHLCFFHEAAKTNFGITQDFVVDQNSASPILPGATYAGIEASHSEMCKFESKNAPGYTAVSANLKRFAQAAPAKIRANWSQEMARMEQAKQFQAFQLLGVAGITEIHPAASFPSLSPPAGPSRLFSSPDVSNLSLVQSETSHRVESESSKLIDAPDPTGPPLIVPAGFRPNSIFVGMERELEELDEKLFDEESRSKGSACVLLWALPGGGKSHLARQYLYENIDKFPGGVFWVRAKSKAEIAQDFWAIAQKVALKDVKDPSLNSFEEDTEVFIKAVKSWFEEREGWLLIFDGISIDKDAEKTGFQAFIPDSKSSAVILTSVDRSLAGSHRLLNPVPLKVLPLSEENARTLLFAELNVKTPTQAELDKATELVRKVERLPLALHAIGHRLRATGEPLAKYHVRPFSDPKLREPFKEIMEDLQTFRHFEARRLIYILSFFGQHIPVEMVQLGVKVLQPLGIEVRAKENGGKPDLNTTLAVLIRYALIERNDPDDEASQGSHPSLAETIDMLRIHSVVQNFICDTLRGERQLDTWLAYAVRVFCHSFHEAYALIKKEGPGLVRDYREYEVHGKRLMDHVTKYRSKSKILEPVHTLLQESLQMIEDEIQRWTPSSSQEAADGQTRVLSIFDRSGSTTDTVPETPEYGPPTLTIWGLENEKPPRDSPVDFQTYPAESSNPQILIPPYQSDDTGYISDLDPDQPMMMAHTPRQPIQPDLPDEHEGLPLDVEQDSQPISVIQEDFQAHRTVSAIKQRRYRDKVNAWRFIPPTIAMPSLSEAQVNQAEIRSPIRTAGEFLTGTSAAEVSLVAVQRRSPPAPRGRGRLTDPRRQSRTRNSDPSTERPRPQSLAGLAADDIPDQNPNAKANSIPPIITSSPLIGIALPGSTAMLRAESADSVQSKQSKESAYIVSPSTLLPISSVQRATVVAQPSYTASLPAQQTYMSSRDSSPAPRYVDFLQSSNPDLRNHSGYHPKTESHPIYRRAKFEDRRSNPKISQRLPASPELGGTISPVDSVTSLARPASPLKNIVPAGEYTVTPYAPVGLNLTVTADPVGYSSEPMSRDNSNQSALEVVSLTGTEPSRYPPPLSSYDVTPRLAAVDPLPSNVAVPVIPVIPGNVSLRDATPRFIGAEDDLVAMGSWAGSPPAASQSPAVLASPLPNTSGPGIATRGNFVRFGDQDALRVGVTKWQLEKEHERNRTKMQQAFDSGAFRPTPPYPIVNPMPRTGSDMRRMMMEEEERRGRRRGMSFPSQPRAVVLDGAAVTAQMPFTARPVILAPASNMDAAIMER